MAKIISLDAGKIFSGKPSGTKIMGFDKPSAFTPAIDPLYVFHEASRDLIVWFLLPHPDPLYIFGPTGCGKSSLVRQIAARLNYSVYESTGHDRLEYPELVGHLSVNKGSMHFEDGPLTLAMKNGGIFLLNEADLCSPATLAGLNTILDGSPLCIAENGGELVTPHPMFRFIVTANSNGGSDETGLYQGVTRMNLAMMDRFILLHTDYPAPDEECRLLDKIFPQLPDDVISKMVNFANDVRKQFMGNNGAFDALDVTLSTRTLIRWAELTVAFQPLSNQGISPVKYAMDRALGFRASTTSRAALSEMVQRYFPDMSTTR